MIEHAGTPAVHVINDWFIETGCIYGLTADRRYVFDTIDTTNHEHRPTREGRIYGLKATFVLGRPLGTIEQEVKL